MLLNHWSIYDGKEVYSLFVSLHCQVLSHFTCLTAAMMSSIYEEHKDEDGFLYFTYSGENTFGDFNLW